MFVCIYVCALVCGMFIACCRMRGYFQRRSINWRLNLSLAQLSQAKMKPPNSQFEFGIKTGEVTVSALDEALLCVSVQCCSRGVASSDC